MEETTKKATYATPVAIVLAGLIIAGAVIYGNYQERSPDGDKATDLTITNIIPVSQTDHVRGKASASLAVIEYSDLECPFCKMFHQTMLELTADPSVETAWVYRHFPIESLHKKARREAIAAECATVQGGHEAFWKYIDEIFAITPSNDGLPDTELPAIAGRIGLNVSTFNSCLANEATISRIDADYQSGLDIGVDGTPFVIIINKENIAYPIFRYNSPAQIPDEEVRLLAEKIFTLYEKNILAAQNR